MSSQANRPEEGIVPPAVGLNWLALSRHLDINHGFLQREGAVVIAGEYFPEAGFAFDPVTLEAHSVTAGDMSFHHCLFLGELAIRNFRNRISPIDVSPIDGEPVIPRRAEGPIIALFADDVTIERTKQRILEGAIGSGLSVQRGPLGPELRVERTHLPGRVATVIAGHGGALLSMGGRSLDIARPVEAAPHGEPPGTPDPPSVDGINAPRGETGL